MNEKAIVLKSDGAGQVQTPVERRVALVREFERSGLSGPKFAAMAGVKYQTFVTWRRKHGSASPARQQSRTAPVAFVEAIVSTGRREGAKGKPAADLVIELPGGVQLRIQNAAQIPLAAQFLNVLVQAPPC